MSPDVPAVSADPDRSIASEAGQAIPIVLGTAILSIAIALIFVTIGSAVTAKGRAQGAADIAALAGARSMLDDLGRVRAPAELPDGTPNPAHMELGRYLERARLVAFEAAQRNGAPRTDVAVSWPDRAAGVPLEIEVVIGHPGSGSRAGRGREGLTHGRVAARAAIRAAPSDPGEGGRLVTAEGGGYVGRLAYRQGKPMRPDVARAFDRLAIAASAAGHSLIINSAFRSDAEQAELWAANPDPRWVARPGTSLHRCGTELDLGPPAAHGWLAANAPAVGFLLRYPWEPWHFGFDRGPAPCSTDGPAPRDRVPGGARAGGDGRLAGLRTVPEYVPRRYRRPLAAAASVHDVAAELLAAQLMAESAFDPDAVSLAGAAGIAQFMPATAAAYGLRDRFDPEASIDAQARLMSDLLDRFGSRALALAAYNAGPAPVAACGCVPAYPETEAYVARILALIGSGPGRVAAAGGGSARGSPAAASPGLVVRLVQ